MTNHRLAVLGAMVLAGESVDEWFIARTIYPTWDKERRSKGARIRVIVQALWRLERAGRVGYFFTDNGTRLWFLRWPAKTT